MLQQRPAIWSRDFSLLWLTNFLMATSFCFLLPTVPTFAVNVLGADKTEVGYLIGLFTLSALLIRPLAGYLLDAKGRRMTYLIGIGLFALIVFSYSIATIFLLLLVIRFLHGLSWGMLTTGGSTVAADLLPPERRGEGLGYYGLTMTVAMAIGPLLGLQVAGTDQYARLFLVAGLLSAGAVGLGLLIRYPSVRPTATSFTFKRFFERDRCDSPAARPPGPGLSDWRGYGGTDHRLYLPGTQ